MSLLTLLLALSIMHISEPKANPDGIGKICLDEEACKDRYK